MSRPAPSGRVWVRLSDVPVAKRREAARRLAREYGMTPIETLQLNALAELPQQNPGLYVSRFHARRICGL